MSSAPSQVSIEVTAATPAYAQLKEQIATLVADGSWPAGFQLPTVRALATQLGLAPNTVARTYRELAAAGVIDTRGRAGTFVSDDPTLSAAKHAASSYVTQIRSLGLSDEQAVALVVRGLAALD